MGKVVKKIAIGIVSVLCVIVAVGLIWLSMISAVVISDWDKYGIQTSVWGCDDKVYYSDGGFGDYVNYGEYYFNEKSIRKFEKNRKYSKVTESNIEYIRSYFSKFDGWLNITDYKDKYTFNKETQIDVGDYYFIYNRYDNRPYVNFDVYYVDMDCNTVYYIHGNI